MRITLDVPMCKKLLEVFLNHDKSSCTDSIRESKHPDSAGWVPCTRCWLLQVVHDDYVPEGSQFDLFSSIKMPMPSDTQELLSQYINLINTLGADHPRSERFLRIYKTNKEFADLAITAKQIRQRIENDLG
jgi:hypothetical protein